jgi:hypothetical protein
VVEQLKNERRLLHQYLDTLYRKNTSAGAWCGSGDLMLLLLLATVVVVVTFVVVVS